MSCRLYATQSHSLLGLPIIIQSPSHYVPPWNKPLCLTVRLINIRPCYQLLLHWIQRTPCSYSPPLPSQQGGLHQHLWSNTHFAAQTNGLLRRLLGITRRYFDKRGHRPGNVQILLNHHLNYLSLCGGCDIEIILKTPYQSHLLQSRGMSHQQIRQYCTTSSACPLIPIPYWPLSSDQIIQ